MLSVTKCRAILGDYAKNLSDDEVRLLRDTLYTLGSFDFEKFQEHEKKEKSDPVYEDQ